MDVKAVFYLLPKNPCAKEVVDNPANSEWRYHHPQINRPVLRIGFSQTPKGPPILASFGRRNHNYVILNKRSRNDQCYFDFNKDSKELLLHDISAKNDTGLCEVVVTYRNLEPEDRPGKPQIWKSPRQCVVLLDPPYPCSFNQPGVGRKWFFIMGEVEFLLIPNTMPDMPARAAFNKQRLAFVHQHDPE